MILTEKFPEIGSIKNKLNHHESFVVVDDTVVRISEIREAIHSHEQTVLEFDLFDKTHKRWNKFTKLNVYDDVDNSKQVSKILELISKVIK